MNTLRSVLAGLLTLALAFGAGYLLRGCRGASDGPTVTQEGPIREKIVYKPANCDEAWKCYYSTLFIRAAFKKRDVLTITAGNMCKEAEQDFRVTCPEIYKRYSFTIASMIGGGYVAGKASFYYGGALGVVRNYGGALGVGGTAFYMQSIGGLDKIGGAGLVLKIDAF